MTGHIEICFNNQWGTICDSQWSAADVRVACRQLEFSPNGNNREKILFLLNSSIDYYEIGFFLFSKFPAYFKVIFKQHVDAVE